MEREYGQPTPEQMGLEVAVHPEALRFIENGDMNGLEAYYGNRRKSIEDLLDFEEAEV